MEKSPTELWDQFGPIVIDLGINVVSALILIIIGWIVASWAQRAVRRGFSRFKDMDRTLIGMFAGVVRYFILVTVLVMSAGAIGLAVGLALQGTLSNIASGVMLLFLRPFRVGDYVNANGNEGTVEEIALFTTDFTTYDGLYLSVPNSSVWGGRIINYTRNPMRRHDIVVGISYNDDIDRAQQVLLEVVRDDERVLDESQAPTAPQILVRELADSSVNLGVRFWTSGDDYWPANFELRKALKQAMDQHGITIPYPQVDLHMHELRQSA